MLDRRNLAWTLALVVVMTLSGCAGPATDKGATSDSPAQGGQASSDPQSSAPAGGSGSGGQSTPAPQPSGSQPQSRVKVDANATFEGVAHAHDQWAGRTQFVVMDRDIEGGDTGVCYGATTYVHPSNPCGYITRLDGGEDDGGDPNNVWPGTGRVRLEVTVGGELVHSFRIGVSTPTAGTYGAFSLVVDEKTESFDMEVPFENMTDPPHYRTSQWLFRVDNAVGSTGYPASLWTGGLHFTATIFRSDRPLPIDPPHPDYWDGATSKVLLEKEGPYKYSKIGLVTNTADPGWGMEENDTVIPGTKKMVAKLSWTNTLPNPVKFAIRYCPANRDCNLGYLFPPVTTDGDNERTFEFEVRPDEADSPYSTRTRWSFAPVYEGADAETVGDQGTFDGTLTFRLEAFKG